CPARSVSVRRAPWACRDGWADRCPAAARPPCRASAAFWPGTARANAGAPRRYDAAVRRRPPWSATIRCAARNGHQDRTAGRDRISGAGAGRREAAVDPQDDDRADGGADEPGALPGLVPADELAEIRRDEGPGDTEYRGQDEAHVVAAWMDELRHNPYD